MARPTKKEQVFIKRRNDLVQQVYEEGVRIADIARMFRLPESTVFNIVENGYKKS